jgi:hypothetical protein
MNTEKSSSFRSCLSARHHHRCYLGTLVGFELGSSSANPAFRAIVVPGLLAYLWLKYQLVKLAIVKLSLCELFGIEFCALFGIGIKS